MTVENMSVVLSANIGAYVSAMGQAEKATERYAKTVQSSMARIANDTTNEAGQVMGATTRMWDRPAVALSEFGGKMQRLGSSMSQVGLSMAPIGVAAAAVFTKSIQSAAEFDKSLRQVAAIAGASSQQMEVLRQGALKWGADTVYSADEVTEGMKELASAGQNTNQIMKNMPSIINLAQATQTNLGEAAKVVAAQLNVFGDTGLTAAKAADILTNASNLSAASVEYMETALSYIGPQARDAGMGLDEVSSYISILANSGLGASKAGTTLRSMLTSLTSPSDKTAATLEQLGVSLYDTDGKFRGFGTVLQDIRKKTAGMNDESKNAVVSGLFDKTATSGALTLLGKSQKSIDNMTKKMGETGTASKAAKKQNEGLYATIERMNGAFDSLGKALGGMKNGPLIDFMNLIDKVVSKMADWAQENPKAAQAIMILLGAVAGIVAALVGLGAIFASIGAVIAGFGAALPVIGALIGAMVSPIGLVGLAIAAIVVAGKALIDNWGAVKKFFANMWQAILAQWYMAGDYIAQFWDGIKTGAIDAWNALVKGLAEFGSGFMSSWNTLWSAVGTWFTDQWNRMKDGAATIWNAISSVASSVWNGIVSVLKSLVDAIVSNVTNRWNNLMNNIQGILNAISSIISGIWNGIKSFLSGVISGIVSMAQNRWNNMKTNFQNITQAISSVVSGIFNGLKNLLGGAIDGAVQWITNAWSNLKGLMGSLTSGIVDRVTSLFKINIDLGAQGRAIMDSFKRGLTAAFEGVKHFVGGIANWIKDHKGPIQYDRKLLIPAGKAIMNGLNAGLERQFGTVMDTVGSMAGQIQGAVDGEFTGAAMSLGNTGVNVTRQLQANIDTNNTRAQPANINLSIGGSTYRTFVNDISNQQNQTYAVTKRL